MLSTCAVCGLRVLAGFRGACAVCHRDLCRDCGNYSYVEYNYYASTVESCCRQCLPSKVTLDLTTAIETVGPAEATASTTVVLLHGGGSCRSMYRPLAAHLATACGAHCVLPDLPGHGGLVDAPLTLASGIERIRTVVQDTEAGRAGRPVILLGGYLLMEYLGRFPGSCCGAIIVNSGSEVGTQAALSTQAGMLVERIAGATLQARTIARLELTRAFCDEESPLHLSAFSEHVLKPGFYFTQQQQVTAALRQCDSAAAMSNVSCPVVYCGFKQGGQHGFVAAHPAGRAEAVQFPSDSSWFMFEHHSGPQFHKRVSAFVTSVARYPISKL